MSVSAACARAGALLAIAGLAAGCNTVQHAPLLLMTDGGEPIAYKRLERFPQRDFFHHWTRQVYLPPKANFEPEGMDQEVIFEQWGTPDYYRKRFRSLEGQMVDEWIYYGDRILFQFVEGRLVYDGAVTDLETLFLRRGFPDRMIVKMGETGKVKHVFYYTSYLDPSRQESYNLTNGRIITATEGN